MFCQVRHCRFSNTHVTIGHKCGKCRKYGHGVLECNNLVLINTLCLYKNNILPEKDWCIVPNCKFNKLHITKAHQCQKCKIIGITRFHSEDNCNIKKLDEIQNIIDSHNIKNQVDSLKDEYLVITIGMGAQCYIRHENNNLLGLIMHQDDWGQYGSSNELDKRPILNQFLDGLTEQVYTSPRDVECPLCRTFNKSTDVTEIKGLEEICKVCMDNPIEYFFRKCMHAVVCKECYHHL